MSWNRRLNLWPLLSWPLLSWLIALGLVCSASGLLSAQEVAQKADAAAAGASQPVMKLRMVFASYRNRPQHPRLYVYEHDGVGQGQIVLEVPTADKRSDHHPSLSADGRLLAFAMESEGQPCQIQVWDLEQKKLLDLPELNNTPHAQETPRLTADGSRLYFSVWRRPGFPGEWDLAAYDLKAKKMLPPLSINAAPTDEKQLAIDATGSRLVFVSNRSASRSMDLFLSSGNGQDLQPITVAATPVFESEPALSGDGRWLVWTADDAEEDAGRDLYLADLQTGQRVELPQLNSLGQEQSPHISHDGRWIWFVSERLDGMGERDVFLYDRQTARLIPTPGLNSDRDDFDPAGIVISSPSSAK